MLLAAYLNQPLITDFKLIKQRFAPQPIVEEGLQKPELQVLKKLRSPVFLKYQQF